MSDCWAKRSPIHKNPDKGSILGGECNRTACTNRGATWWNKMTLGFYCADDAREINKSWPHDPICTDKSDMKD